MAVVAALDPFDMLVRLGKITQANLQAADLVASAVGTSTRAARLVAVGVDKQKLLDALAELTRMPVAPPEMLAAAAPMKLPNSYSMTMKELLAVPIGRVDEHILDIAIADPRTSKKLRDAAIAHRPRLALEPDILEALARVFPETDALDPISEPTLKNVPVAGPRPVSAVEDAVEFPAVEFPASDALLDDVQLADLQRSDTQRTETQHNATQSADAPRDDLPRDEAHPHDEAPLPFADGALIGDEEPAPKARSLSPFVLTKVQTEVTERVRARARARDDSATLTSPPLVQDARAWMKHAVGRVRGRVVNAGARTLSVVVLIAVVTAALVLALVVASAPEEVTVIDAGVVVVDAGEAPALAPTPPVVEEPVKKPTKPLRKKPPRRTTKKRR